jgi:hypothetical protein
MFILLFAVLSVLSAWVSWRNHPMFSARATLRFLLSVGLMLGAAGAAIVAATQFSLRHPGAPGFAALGGTVLLGTLAMIWVIAVSTPKYAPLPVTVKVLTLHRKKVWRWAKRYAATVLAMAVLDLLFRGTAQNIVGAVGGLFVFLGLVLLFTGYVSAHQMDRWLSAVEDNPWLHWSFTAAQWQRWTEAEAAHAPGTPRFLWRRDWRKFAWPVASIAVGVAVFSPGPWLYRGLYVAGVAALLAGLIAASQKSDRDAPRRLRAQLAGAEPEAYFGQEGVFADGVFTPWLTSGVYLQAAWVDRTAPASLRMRFEKLTAGGPASTADVSVPLPERGEGDLATLQRRLREACPKARVELA